MTEFLVEPFAKPETNTQQVFSINHSAPGNTWRNQLGKTDTNQDGGPLLSVKLEVETKLDKSFRGSLS